MSEYDPKHDAPKTHPLLSNSTYDKLKPVTTMGLPALNTLWITLANVWGWSNVEQVAATIGAANVFLGVVLAIASKSYNKSDEKFDGDLKVVVDNPDSPLQLKLELDKTPEELVAQSQLSLRVVNNPQ